MPKIWKSPPPKANAPAVQPKEPSKPKASKPQEEPKEETRVILKEAPAAQKAVLVPKPKRPPKKPPPPPPSPTLSEASVHFHDRAEPDSGSYSYYTEEEVSEAD